MANEYNVKIARLKAKQNEESTLIDAVREKTFEAFSKVAEKGGEVPSNPDDRTLGTALNQSIESIKTDNIPIDEESELLYLGVDEYGLLFSSNAEDENDFGFGRDETGIYVREKGDSNDD